MNEKITVLDIHLVAFLEMMGENAGLEKRENGRVIFILDDTRRVRDLIEKFNNDSELQRFVFCLKRARGRMLEYRDGPRGMSNGNHYADRF